MFFPRVNQAAPGPFFKASGFSLCQVPNRLKIKESPVPARAIANVTVMPSMYAMRMPGSCSVVKAVRICVAPVPMSCMGLTVGDV